MFTVFRGGHGTSVFLRVFVFLGPFCVRIRLAFLFYTVDTEHLPPGHPDLAPNTRF